MAESLQHKLSRVRRPRVHITYKVETEGAEVEMHVEDGRIVIEPVRAKLLEPVSDVGARAERRPCFSQIVHI